MFNLIDLSYYQNLPPFFFFFQSIPKLKLYISTFSVSYTPMDGLGDKNIQTSPFFSFLGGFLSLTYTGLENEHFPTYY